jgi:hypothetical protein
VGVFLLEVYVLALLPFQQPAFVLQFLDAFLEGIKLGCQKAVLALQRRYLLSQLLLLSSLLYILARPGFLRYKVAVLRIKRSLVPEAGFPLH